MLFSALVFFLSTGWHGIVADSQALGDSWLASNATRLHGATYANGPTDWNDPPTAKRCVAVSR